VEFDAVGGEVDLVPVGLLEGVEQPADVGELEVLGYVDPSRWRTWPVSLSEITPRRPSRAAPTRVMEA
jgi:hypothetical protein